MTTRSSHNLNSEPEPLFPPGRIFATPGAVQLLQESGQNPVDFIARHLLGDWSEMDCEDKQCNRRAVIEGARVLSSYSTANQKKIWVITEADRSVTTLLLPSEY